MAYKVKLKKDRGPHKEGEFANPANLKSYINLYKDGYIDDDLNLIEKKSTKTKTKKAKEDIEENTSNNK